VLSTLRGWSENWRKAADKKVGELVNAQAFPHVHRIRGWIWRSNAWAQTRLKSCQWVNGRMCTSWKAS